jgi:hypothetical protein
MVDIRSYEDWGTPQPEDEPAGLSYSDKMKKIDPSWGPQIITRGRDNHEPKQDVRLERSQNRERIEPEHQPPAYEPPPEPPTPESEDDALPDFTEESVAALVAVPDALAEDPLAVRFAEDMGHEGWDNETIASVLDWYASHHVADEEADAIIEEMDNEHTEEALGELERSGIDVGKLKDWLLTNAPDGTAHALVGARLPDGRALGNDPATLRWLNALMEGQQPTRAYYSDAADDMRISEIEKTMRERRTEYNRDPKMQKEYLELLRRREKRNDT